MVAYLLSGYFYNLVGPKISFIVSFVLAFIGALLYIFLRNDFPSAVPFMLMLGKFGLSGAFNMVFLANSIFPSIYSATTIGICSIFSRSITFFAPMMAEL